MSTAFQLDFTEDELNERAAAAVTSYGVGTRSYNRSAEKREMDRQRKAVTARYENSARQPIAAALSCTCAQRPYPHDLSAHGKLFESPGSYTTYEDVRVRFAPEGMRWPWSLRHAPKMEAP